jgi:hypothetical protein
VPTRSAEGSGSSRRSPPVPGERSPPDAVRASPRHRAARSPARNRWPQDSVATRCSAVDARFEPLHIAKLRPGEHRGDHRPTEPAATQLGGDHERDRPCHPSIVSSMIGSSGPSPP